MTHTPNITHTTTRNATIGGLRPEQSRETWCCMNKAATTWYSVKDVATMLKVSDDTVIRQFEGRSGCIDIGTPETTHKRKKRLLRISSDALLGWIDERQVKLRRRV